MNSGTALRPFELLRALEGLKNWRAIVMLIGSGLLAIFLFALGIRISVSGSSVFGIAIDLIAAAVWLFGICAAGMVLMDAARGLEPPSFVTAFFAGAASFVKSIAVLVLAAIATLLYWLIWAAVFFVCKLPGLGVVLFAIAFPVAIILTALVTLGVFVAFGLLLPSLWEGNTVMAAIARLIAIASKRPIDALVYFFMLGLLMAFVGTVIFGTLGFAFLSVSGISVAVMGFGLGDFSGLLGGIFQQHHYYGGFGGGSGFGGFGGDESRTGSYLTAAGIDGAIILGVVMAALFSVYLMGLNIIYLMLSEGVDPKAAEAMLSERMNQMKQKAEEAQERARQHIQQAQEQRQAAAATTTDKKCIACGAQMGPADEFCGECGRKAD